MINLLQTLKSNYCGSTEYRQLLALLMCKRKRKQTQNVVFQLLGSKGLSMIVKTMNLAPSAEFRKLAAIVLCKLVHENTILQERFCERLGFDLIYSSDGIARVCLNKIPQKFVTLLKKQSRSLPVILDQINKIQHPTKDPPTFYWVFP